MAGPGLLGRGPIAPFWALFDSAQRERTRAVSRLFWGVILGFIDVTPLFSYAGEERGGGVGEGWGKSFSGLSPIAHSVGAAGFVVRWRP